MVRIVNETFYNWRSRVCICVTVESQLWFYIRDVIFERKKTTMNRIVCFYFKCFRGSAGDNIVQVRRAPHAR